MLTAKNVLSTSDLSNNFADMYSVTLMSQGYARIGLKDSTKQRLLKINDAVEYVYGVAELTTEYIILVTRHHMKSGQFMDYAERII